MRGRFAPSPTGDLHLGNARTALLAWLQVRSAGGTLVMRVEDLDPGRVRPGMREAQLEDLRWMGLDWDEGPDTGGPFAPYVQTRRAADYEAALRSLATAGRVYCCRCSRREIAAAASAPHGPLEEGPRYPGTCAARPCAEPGVCPGEAIRFRTPPGIVSFDDELCGRLDFAPEAEVGDFVVRRKDGVAAYQLAVVVDDAAMRITHVLRGADLLSSTARQILLYRALGLREPTWLHVPLLLGPDGERLSKRHGSVTLREAREAGVAAERLVGWLAATCGLAAEGESLTPRELAPRFDVRRLGSDPYRVDEEPLRQLLS
jgi:glutamyl-tRNA synthetase